MMTSLKQLWELRQDQFQHHNGQFKAGFKTERPLMADDKPHDEWESMEEVDYYSSQESEEADHIMDEDRESDMEGNKFYVT
jgi:hypothetical protein